MAFPERTPGSLGINDAGDPTRFSLLGDTPGPTGINDWGAPDGYSLPGMKTFHDWALETKFHIPADAQFARLYPAGNKDEVMNKAYEFLLAAEKAEEHPYVPVNKSGAAIGHSGITIGVGYDLGQCDEKKIRQDWAELTSRIYQASTMTNRMSLGLPTLQVDQSIAAMAPPPPKLSLSPMLAASEPLDRLARAHRLRREKALQYLKEVKDISIPVDLSLKVFKQRTLPEKYDLAVKFFPGLKELPTGVQVAIISLVYNTGLTHKKEGKVNLPGKPVPAPPPPSFLSSFSFGLRFRGQEPLPQSGGAPKFTLGIPALQLGSKKTAKKAASEPAMIETSEEDFFGQDWEKRQLQSAVLCKDLVWIYWYFESMRRIWAKDQGLVRRREDEADLILPYVHADLQREAWKQRHPGL